MNGTKYLYHAFYHVQIRLRNFYCHLWNTQCLYHDIHHFQNPLRILCYHLRNWNNTNIRYHMSGTKYLYLASCHSPSCLRTFSCHNYIPCHIHVSCHSPSCLRTICYHFRNTQYLYHEKIRLQNCLRTFCYHFHDTKYLSHEVYRLQNCLRNVFCHFYHIPCLYHAVHLFPNRLRKILLYKSTAYKDHNFYRVFRYVSCHFPILHHTYTMILSKEN